MSLRSSALAVFVTLLALSGVAGPSRGAAAVQTGEQPDASATAPATPPAQLSPDRVIVQWADGASHADRDAVRDAAGTTPVQTLGDPQFQLVKVEPGQTVPDAVDTLNDHRAVEVAEPDRYDSPTAVPNDPLFNRQWGLRNLGGPLGVLGFASPLAGADAGVLAAWDRTTGSPSVIVADLDTGYRASHPDLAAVQTTGYDFVGSDADHPVPDPDPTDDDLVDGGHGVHTAGIIGAQGNNGTGITGIAQDVRIMPLRVCSYSAVASQEKCPVSSQIDAINYAGSHGARVANMSLGSTTPSDARLAAFAGNPQTLFVVSAGNDNNDPKHPAPGYADNDVNAHYPCNDQPAVVDNVICVAATDQADQLASFSDYGATSVDLGAPGTEILSTYPEKSAFSESFEGAGFSSWTTSTTAGTTGPFVRTSGSPLTTFGITDSVGDAAPSTTHSSQSPNAFVPAGTGACTFYQTRTVRVSNPGSSYVYAILRNGTPLFTSLPITTSGRTSTVPITGLGGSNVAIRVTFTTGTSPGSDGVWLDDLDLECIEPIANTTGYGYLNGTSMAAPFVSGAAGLLFSLKPTATVTEVRNALLQHTDPVAALAGKTVSGGRLDVAQAMNALVPPAAPDPGVDATPASVTPPTTSTVTVPPSPTPADTAPPRITSLHASPTTFAVDPKGKAAIAVAARKKKAAAKGTTLTFTSSEAARMVFVVQKSTTGRTVSGRCVKATKGNAKKKPCTLHTAFASFGARATAGRNRVAFTGFVGRKRMTAGRFRIAATATDAAGNPALPVLVDVTVVAK